MSGVNLGDRDVFLKGDISRPPPGYSMLEQYARDWGFGKNLGSVHKKHRHNCEWAVPHALKEWDDHFSMGKPPVKPLSPAEMAGAGSSSASAETPSTTPVNVPGENTPPQLTTDGEGFQTARPPPRAARAAEAQAPDANLVARALEHVRGKPRRNSVPEIRGMLANDEMVGTFEGNPVVRNTLSRNMRVIVGSRRMTLPDGAVVKPQEPTPRR